MAGMGRLKFDQPDFKYPVYIEKLVMIISMNWFKPAQSVQRSPVVHFQIERDGTITDPRMVTSSGLPLVDRAALRAVIASSPVPPLPAEYGGAHLGIQVVFD
jgi:protein TonB